MNGQERYTNGFLDRSYTVPDRWDTVSLTVLKPFVDRSHIVPDRSRIVPNRLHIVPGRSHTVHIPFLTVYIPFVSFIFRLNFKVVLFRLNEIFLKILSGTVSASDERNGFMNGTVRGKRKNRPSLVQTTWQDLGQPLNWVTPPSEFSHHPQQSNTLG